MYKVLIYKRKWFSATFSEVNPTFVSLNRAKLSL
jgi:hypothetical protein